MTFKEAYLVIGRFQGYTIKHNELVWTAKGDVVRRRLCVPVSPDVMVGIVCGKETSKDREMNPFSFVDRVWMIKQCHPELKCLMLGTAFLGDVIEILYGLGYDLKTLYVGGDRKETYMRQVKRYKYNIGIRLLSRRNPISGTGVREALREDDDQKFHKLTPMELHGHYEKIKTMYDINFRERSVGV